MPSVRHWLPPTVTACLSAALLGPATVHAQYDTPPPPAAYAIQNVTLVRADGSRQPGMTIVIRGAFIEGLGRELPVPADAEVLEGDSLFVYPGMVDAQSGAKLALPEPEIDRQELEPWNPPRDVQGFTPHRLAAAYLSATGGELAKERAAGVVAGALLPDGPVMPGRAAALLYRADAEAPMQLVVHPDLGPVFSLRGARGVYPSSLFAAVAFVRQSFENARHEGAVIAAHQRDPKGLEIPAWDPDHAVLRAVLAGELPAYFAVDRAEEIRTVLALSEEYGFAPVIVGGDEAWQVADRLRERRIPVLVSLDFPTPKRWKPAKTRDTTEAAPTEPADPAVEREREQMEKLYANAGRLAAAGVTVALTSGGGKADLREGARKAIEYGLDTTAALQALTSVPAGLLDMPVLGRIEAGLPATLVVATGELFDEGTQIAYTFVNGGMEPGKPKKMGGGEAPTVDVSGVWSLSIEAGGQRMGGRMTLTQTEAEFSGTLDLAEMGQLQITGGTVSGTDITFTLVIRMGGEVVEADARGTVEGDEASGTGGGPMGDFTWEATRIETPGRSLR
jgi:imidazolonepropionase-like amidohydrolase